ncbi:MAG: hypothetical protein M2R45_03524 [Verrucomicrobia subdivision 3 bacterium]|nr:hypothetical protein [Limisphaerales bacterium]MCS1415921.1 hypothetical protein [Limisphaerales bacterium]
MEMERSAVKNFDRLVVRVEGGVEAGASSIGSWDLMKMGTARSARANSLKEWHRLWIVPIQMVMACLRNLRLKPWHKVSVEGVATLVVVEVVVRSDQADLSDLG